MKIKGEKLSKPNVEILVLPRTDEDGKSINIVFKAKAILDLEPFRKLVPVPKAPKIRRRGGVVSEDVEDKNYKIEVEEYSQKRFDWMVVESLKATDDLEWETVDYSNSDTWKNYKTELKDSGFSEWEVGKIIQTVLIANSLDESKMEEARKSFLAGLDQIQEQLTSPNGEQ